MSEFLTQNEPDLYQCVLEELGYVSTPDPKLVNSTLEVIAHSLVRQSEPFSEEDGEFATILIGAIFSSDRRGLSGTDKLVSWLVTKVNELSSEKVSIRKLDRDEARAMMSYGLKSGSALYLEMTRDDQKPLLIEISDTLPPVKIIEVK